MEQRQGLFARLRSAASRLQDFGLVIQGGLFLWDAWYTEAASKAG